MCDYLSVVDAMVQMIQAFLEDTTQTGINFINSSDSKIRRLACEVCVCACDLKCSRCITCVRSVVRSWLIVVQCLDVLFVNKERKDYSNPSKKLFPLSSTRRKAGKSTTSIFQMASMPNSGYSRHSTFLMFSFARTAAGPPIDPR